LVREGTSPEKWQCKSGHELNNPSRAMTAILSNSFSMLAVIGAIVALYFPVFSLQ
jgi:hypothetical protein